MVEGGRGMGGYIHNFAQESIFYNFFIVLIHKFVVT